MSPPPTEEELHEVAQRAVEIFTDRGLDCFLFGSFACALYGTTRTPGDVDLIVLIDEEVFAVDSEDLKRILVDEDSDFFLVAPDYPANYDFLYYTLPSARRRSHRKCRVDILTPGGKLKLPDMPSQHIKKKQHLPVMPILPLLLTKLRGWSDHRRRRKRRKMRNDVEDIDDLLLIACGTGTHLNSNSTYWLPEDFVDASQRRIYKYVEKHPDSAGYWKRLGFDAYE